MKIKYAGPRPSISHTGIAFESYHPDKFIYFQDIFHLFLLIEAAPSETGPLLYTKPTAQAPVSDILSWVHKYHDEIENDVNTEIEAYKERLNRDEESVLEKSSISEEEQKIFQNNLKIMHDYRVQRATNKILYWHMIDTICDIIIRKHINQFVFPFEINLYHIVEAIANHVAVRRMPLRPNIVLKENQNGKVLIYFILSEI